MTNLGSIMDSVGLPVFNVDENGIQAGNETAQKQIMQKVFTPLNADETERLSFKDSEVTYHKGYERGRGLGLKGLVTINGQDYEVYGLNCSLPNCACDAKIVPVEAK